MPSNLLRGRPSYQLSMLELPRIVKAFGAGLRELGQSYIFTASSDLDSEWERFVESVHTVAKKLIAQVGSRHRQLNELIRNKRNSEMEKVLCRIEKTAHISSRIKQTCKLIQHFKKKKEPRPSPISAAFLHQEMTT